MSVNKNLPFQIDMSIDPIMAVFCQPINNNNLTKIPSKDETFVYKPEEFKLGKITFAQAFFQAERQYALCDASFNEVITAAFSIWNTHGGWNEKRALACVKGLRMTAEHSCGATEVTGEHLNCACGFYFGDKIDTIGMTQAHKWFDWFDDRIKEQGRFGKVTGEFNIDNHNRRIGMIVDCEGSVPSVYLELKQWAAGVWKNGYQKQLHSRVTIKRGEDW
ncbi:unnamed protein product [Cunninghamella blakesleeana]